MQRHHHIPKVTFSNSMSRMNQPTTRVVVVERRDPTSTNKSTSNSQTKDSDIPSKRICQKSSKKEAATLPNNYKHVAKVVNRHNDGELRALLLF
jgi:hypothetical protein